MALPVVQDLKDYLRIETTAEDDRIDALLVQAENMVETWLQRPMTALAVAYVDECEGSGEYLITKLIYPVFPIASTPAVTVVDGDGNTVAATEYRVDRRTGILRGTAGVTFSTPPYTITATAGLSAASDYATRIEPVLNRAILDVASDLYHRTNPNALQESAGGGAATQYGVGQVPPRVQAMLSAFRLERVA